jgi:parvulin-like peptidyl-prolyl isomerase
VKLLKEPLIHFLLIGAALFALYGVLHSGDNSASDEIIVSTGQIESLAATFSNRLGRPPSAEELTELINDYVAEEVLSREAIKLGLDRNDPVIRSRLEQKMMFFANDFDALTEPSEGELADYLAAHPEEFQKDARFSFRQVYLNPEERRGRLALDADKLLEQLNEQGARAQIEGLGDGLQLPRQFVQEPGPAVLAQFGELFVQGLEQAPLGEWVGPFSSKHGQHLVVVTERTEARMPALEKVRSRVERALLAARRQEANQRLLDELLQRYTVTIKWPEAPAGSVAEGQTAQAQR